uniref:Uncharacterized protein n=1 Tax=Picea sitchensis TaxID=3332 RepID=D5ADN4_PICSI|nr:unknown [Picea sitchensis]
MSLRMAVSFDYCTINMKVYMGLGNTVSFSNSWHIRCASYLSAYAVQSSLKLSVLAA